MSVVSSHPSPQRKVAELHSGDRMNRREFHEIYSQMPESFRAELVGGIVYVASPLRIPHGQSDPLLITLFSIYSARTPGTQVCSNTTVLLGEDAEPQPDVLLRVLPEYGGQSETTADQYVKGAPELIAEIAHSSRALDLGGKLSDYARHGVKEYLVLSLDDQHLHWFDLAANRELTPDADGILKMRTFPGLWVDRDGLLSRDMPRLINTLDRGLAAPEHNAFANKLAQHRSQ